MTRFLIDADEVLANFADPACEAISKVLGRPWTLERDRPRDTFDMFGDLSEEDYTAVFKIMHAEGWCSAIEPYSGAREGVQRIKGLCDEVLVVTTPQLSPTWTYERTLWLGQHFGFLPREVTYTMTKYICGGDFFLDDHPNHVKSWQEEHPKGHAMLWTSAHNRYIKGHDHYRVDSWDTVLERITLHG